MTPDEVEKVVKNLDQMHRNLVRDGAVINTVVERSIFSDAAEALRTALAECDALVAKVEMQRQNQAMLRAENEQLKRKLAFYTLPDDYEAPH